jgi:hypothetical protein
MADSLRSEISLALNNKQSIHDIINYCASSFSAPNVDKGAAIDSAKEYLRDTTNAVSDNLLKFSDSLSSIVEQHMVLIADARHRVNSVSTVCSFLFICVLGFVFSIFFPLLLHSSASSNVPRFPRNTFLSNSLPFGHISIADLVS